MSLFKPGTKRYIIASMHASGLTERETYTELRQKVADQVRPWTFHAQHSRWACREASPGAVH
jgi:hypothetical protein